MCHQSWIRCKNIACHTPPSDVKYYGHVAFVPGVPEMCPQKCPSVPLLEPPSWSVLASQPMSRCAVCTAFGREETASSYQNIASATPGGTPTPLQPNESRVMPTGPSSSTSQFQGYFDVLKAHQPKAFEHTGPLVAMPSPNSSATGTSMPPIHQRGPFDEVQSNEAGGMPDVDVGSKSKRRATSAAQSMPIPSPSGSNLTGPTPNLSDSRSASSETQVVETKARPAWLPPSEPLTELPTGQIVPLAWMHHTKATGTTLRLSYSKSLELENNRSSQTPLILEDLADFKERQRGLRTDPGSLKQREMDREFALWAEDIAKTQPHWLTSKALKQNGERVLRKEGKATEIAFEVAGLGQSGM